MSEKTILKEDIQYLQKRRRDNVGDVFEWQGKILRGIFPSATELVKSLFESNFIAHLVEENLHVESWMTDYELEGYGLVIEHKKIWPVIYPQAWTFSMLKDAALAILKIAQVARRYGYNMKDCHGFNVLFDGNQPKFIDLGSFHKIKDGSSGWEPFKEFLQVYYYPLFMWKDGMEYVAKLSIFSANKTPHSEHFIYKHRYLRFLKAGVLEKLIKIRFIFSDLACIDHLSLQNRLKNKNLFVRKGVWTLKRIVDRLGMSNSQSLGTIERKIKNVSKRCANTAWNNYHGRISKKKSRFDSIIEYIHTYCPDAKTAIDIAGNQGLFAETVLSETNIEKVICQDLDERAVDIGYNKAKSQPTNISYVNYNAMAPIVKMSHSVPSDRFKADVVFSLALLHHLLLSQGYSIEDILEELKKYSKRYVFIEFMPKGLWISGREVNIPEWYTRDWFREHFKKYFQLIREQQIAENYIIFVGKY